MGIPYAEVIGDPIAHSKSPLIHKFWLEKLGMEGDYRAVQISADELSDYFEQRRKDLFWRGCNVAMPHKVAAAALLDGLFEGATVTRAVNTVYNYEGKLAGNNTDLRGFAEPFRRAFTGRGSALVIGAGGAARAVFIALTALGFSRIGLMNRTAEKGHALLAALGQEQSAVAWTTEVPAVDLLVNASAMGMEGAEAPKLDLSRMPPSAIVYDLVYEPRETPLLAAARQRGLRTIEGISMLIGQAAASFCYFFDGQPPRQHDRQLLELLTS